MFDVEAPHRWEDLVLSIRRWRASHLFSSWIAYWLLLLGYVARRPLLEYWRITRTPGGHGSVAYTYSGGMLQAALWIAGPPLLLFLVWLVTRADEPREQLAGDAGDTVIRKQR